MMETEKLRKADLITSIIIILFGTWMCTEAFKMPMKDSWGGVQNVWYVSPALLPLVIGIVLMLLGLYLFFIAFRSVGSRRVISSVRMLCDRDRRSLRISEPAMRFFAIVTLFLFFVYMNIPRIDFFLSSLLFLIVFIIMFYLDDAIILTRLFIFYLIGSFVFLLYFATPLDSAATAHFVYSTDVLALVFIGAFSIYARVLIKDRADLKRRYRIGMIVAVCVPFILCPVFKYFLLVPLPAEGVVVELMDALYYSIF